MDILIEKTNGYTDCQHLDRLKSLLKVMTSTYTQKIGRGKKAVYEDKLKYTTTSDVKARENLIYSIQIFTQRCLKQK